ncbi:MAG: hypothetical protein Q7W30_06135 [Coriobacteriia bacterium]|nr:hypothetical protein [Coriobacteriia bacterium]
MSQNHKSRSVRMTAILVVLMLAFGAVALVGCGGTKEAPGGPSGTGAPKDVKYAAPAVANEVLAAAAAAGYKFDKSFVWVLEGESPAAAEIAGPLTAKDGSKTEKLALHKGKDGKWAVVAK